MLNVAVAENKELETILKSWHITKKRIKTEFAILKRIEKLPSL